jgi:hypothetical protein
MINSILSTLLTIEIVARSKFDKFLKKHLTFLSRFRYDDYMFYRQGRMALNSQITRYALNSAPFSGFASLNSPPPPVT